MERAGSIHAALITGRGWRVGVATLSVSLLLGACAPAQPTTTPAKPTAASASAAPAASAAPVSSAASPQPSPAASPAALPAPSASPSAASAPSGTLRVATPSEIESLHPFFANQIVGISVRMNLFDSLVERDFAGNIVPGLAESWNVVDDHTIDFQLRHGVKFHDGSDFTADDVKFSFDYVLDEANKSPSRSFFAAISQIQVLNPYSVRFVLSQTDARLFDALATSGAILPAKYHRQVGTDGFMRKPVGTGPFKFVEWVKDDHLTLEANESYWDGSYKGQPRVKTVVLRPVPNAATRVADLRSGAVDMIMDVPSDQVAALRSTGFVVDQQDTTQYDYVFMDTTKEPFNHPEVRQALNYAVDRPTIVQTVLGGFARPLTGPLSPLTLGYNADAQPYSFDLAKARQLLTAAGQGNGFDTTIDYTTGERQVLPEVLAAQLGQVGVRVKLNPLDVGVFNDRWVKKQLSPLSYVRWSTFTDPALLDLLAGCKGFLSMYCNQQAQVFLDEGGATLDQVKREAAYKQATRLLAEDPFAIYLFQLQSLTGHTNNVQGWRPHAASYFLATNARVQ